VTRNQTTAIVVLGNLLVSDQATWKLGLGGHFCWLCFISGCSAFFVGVFPLQSKNKTKVWV